MRSISGMPSDDLPVSENERALHFKWEEGKMEIRRAKETDMEDINRLLCQVLMVHHNGRPDLFRANVKKYTDSELAKIIADDTRPIFVGIDENGRMLGYAFCMFEEHDGSNILAPVKTLYIDDICVDETLRGQHVGSLLYEHVLAFAKELGCYNLTLNVWECNPSARKFYEAKGLVPYKTCMEKIL